MYRQYKLSGGKTNDLSLICWLNNPTLRVGAKITLRDTAAYKDVVWKVDERYEPVEEESQWRTWKIKDIL